MKKLILFLLAFLFAFVPFEFAYWQQFQCNAQHNAAKCDVPISSPLCISWRHKLGGVLDTALPLIDDNSGLYINNSTCIYKFDALSGAVLWCTNTGSNYTPDGTGILYNNSTLANLPKTK